jgi:antitoxin ParD1/3/4
MGISGGERFGMEGSDAMASLNVPIPEELREFVERRTRETHHATPAEYIRWLLREDQKRAEQDKLDKLLLEGLDSGKPLTINDLDGYFAKKKQSLLDRINSKGRRK